MNKKGKNFKGITELSKRFREVIKEARKMKITDGVNRDFSLCIKSILERRTN